MPSSAEHKAKADQNRAFLQTIDATAEPAWAAIVAFYTAMHLVERLSACESIHHDRHQDRLHYLTRHKRHRAIHRAFRALFDASLVARYGTVNQFTIAFPGDTVPKTLIGNYLTAIEAYVTAHFASPSTSAGS